ncbi:hypothetical protein CSUI_005423, partial [Cystoisospora suis]
MKRSFGRGVDFTLIILVALGLAALFPLGVESERASDGSAASPGEGVPECGKDPAGKVEGEQKLELTAKKGEPLEFKCATTYTLSPEDGADQDMYTKAYQVLDNRNCSNAASELTAIVSGATLKKTTGKPPAGNEPVYTFLYDSPQDAEKGLCYTCTSPTPPSGDSEGAVSFSTLALGSDAPAKTPCTVRITVPKDETTPVTTAAPPVPTAEAPSASTTKAPT